MRLERRVHHVSGVEFGARTRLHAGRLALEREQVRDMVLADDRIQRCNVELVAPGENARVVHICDTVEPQWRASGPTFPGWQTDAQTVGDGITHRLAGV